MNFRLSAIIILLILSGVVLSGCSSPSGVFARTEERTINLGNSITNIALDGDGIN